MTDSEWLAGLKAGDEVVIESSLFRLALDEVTRSTKTALWVGQLRFSRSSGRNSRCTWLRQPTDELRQEVELQRRRAFAKALLKRAAELADKIPLEKLEAIAAVIEDTATVEASG